jgi:hypothetical protein
MRRAALHFNVSLVLISGPAQVEEGLRKKDAERDLPQRNLRGLVVFGKDMCVIYRYIYSCGCIVVFETVPCAAHRADPNAPCVPRTVDDRRDEPCGDKHS